MSSLQIGRTPAVAALALTLAACSSGGGNGGPDTRCFGVAQVAAWQVHVTSTFSDTGTIDSFTVALHASVNATGSTGPVTPSNTNPNGFGWFGGKPTGTLAVKDTVITAHAVVHDTVVGTASAFGPGPNPKTGPYVSVDLASCKATLGATLYSVVTETQPGQPTVVDTILAAYPFQPGITVDSLFVANGVSIAATKVPSVTPGASFGTTGEYRAGGFVGPYQVADTTRFDSATVAWTLTPLAAVPAPGRAGAAPGLLPNGAVLPPKR